MATYYLKRVKKMAKPKKSAVIEEMTVKQFQTWIKGLCAFQDDGWLPNKNQWEHIRQLIDNLQETTTVVQQVVSHAQQIHIPTQPSAQVATRTEGHVQPTMTEAQALSTDVAPTPQKTFLGAGGITRRGQVEMDEFGKPVASPLRGGESDFA